MPDLANDTVAVGVRRRMRELVRLRWAVRGVLIFGLAASIAANVLHARPNPTSQMISAWPPLSLLLTVELVSRVPVHRWWRTTIRVLATGSVAGIAAWVSYGHMAEVARRFGETGQTPYLLPVSVDGLIIVASICLVELTGRVRDVKASRPAQDSHNAVVAGDVSTQAVAGPAGTDPSDAAPTRPAGTARARASGRRKTTAVRSDEQLLAVLANLPRDPDGNVPVRRAAAALGTGPDRARRLLTQAGLRRIADLEPRVDQTAI
jgi:hypothetical protein